MLESYRKLNSLSKNKQNKFNWICRLKYIVKLLREYMGGMFSDIWTTNNFKSSVGGIKSGLVKKKKYK